MPSIRGLRAALAPVSRSELWRFTAYFIAGSSYFWSGYATFALCYGVLHSSWWLAKAAGDVVGWTLNYVLQRYWAFNTSSLAQHETRNRSRYIALTAVNFALDYAIVGGLKQLGVSPYYGLFVAAAFFTIWNYIWYKWWVFTEKI